MEKKIITSAAIKNVNISKFFHDAFDLDRFLNID